MSHDLIKLFDNHQIRILESSEGPEHVWFVLRDVLEALGSSTRPSDAKTAIEEGLGEGVVIDYPLQTAGGVQQTAIIHESAALFLASRSRTEAGRRLNRWLFCTVLPEIRRTGRYVHENAQPTSLEALLSALPAAVQEAARLASQSALAELSGELSLQFQQAIEARRYEIPEGYLTFDEAYAQYAGGISRTAFRKALHYQNVRHVDYQVKAKIGPDRRDSAYLDEDVLALMEAFSNSIVQVTDNLFTSSLIRSERFRFTEEEISEMAEDYILGETRH